MKNKDRAAFAVHNGTREKEVGKGISYGEYGSDCKGLTKREYFAAKAMPVILHYVLKNSLDNGFAVAAEDAVNMADALLKQLEKS